MPNIHCKQCHMEFSDENQRCPGCGRIVDAAGPSVGEERPEGGIVPPLPPDPPPEPQVAGDDQGPGITIGPDTEPGSESETEPGTPGEQPDQQPA